MQDLGAETGCFFCAAWVAPPEEDRANLVLLRGTRAFVMFNKYPYNSGHLMVAPVQHTGDLGALGEDCLAEVFRLTVRVQQLLQDSLRPHGFNLGMNLGRAGGAGVEDHIHLHLVPRWLGDTNFMPVLADTKVLPVAAQEIWDHLRGGLVGDAATPSGERPS